MKKILILGFIVLNTALSFSQARLTKYPVGNTGAFVYMPGEPTWEVSMSEDGSDVYTGNVEIDSVDYAAIIIQFKEKFDHNNDELRELLTSYIDFIGTNLMELMEMVPIGYGHTLDSNPKAIGAITYGIDVDGYNYALKGWIDNEFLAILIVASENKANFNTQELFLNGFRFPAK